MKNWQAIAVGLIIGLLGGVGSMQATIWGDVREHSSELSHLKSTQSKDRDQFQRQIDSVLELVKASLEQQKQSAKSQEELIRLLRDYVIKIDSNMKGHP